MLCQMWFDLLSKLGPLSKIWQETGALRWGTKKDKPLFNMDFRFCFGTWVTKRNCSL
jgi:hypothetical protein